MAPIREDLGWKPPYTMQAGLEATAQWYRKTKAAAAAEAEVPEAVEAPAAEAPAVEPEDDAEIVKPAPKKRASRAKKAVAAAAK